jgi:hypothetical protein
LSQQRKIRRTLACATTEAIRRTEKTGEHFWNRPSSSRTIMPEEEEEDLCI